MSELKPGDRVSHKRTGEHGTIVELRQGNGLAWALVEWSFHALYYVDQSNLMVVE